MSAARSARRVEHPAAAVRAVGRRLSRLMVALLCLCALAVSTASPSTAIVRGQPDNESHPGVAFLSSYLPGGRFRCTGTLVSPTVILTAGHCTLNTLGKTAVTFQSVIAEAPPSPLPAASNPAAGYTSEELTSYGWLAGTAFTHPDAQLTDVNNVSLDLGVVVLDEPIYDRPYATLAKRNYLKRFPAGRLTKSWFSAVGYGVDQSGLDSSGAPVFVNYPIMRKAAAMIGFQITDQALVTDAERSINDPSAGRPPVGIEGNRPVPGGTCFGDSGGPIFHRDTVVAVVSLALTRSCGLHDRHQRIDIASAQDWISSFGVSFG